MRFSRESDISELIAQVCTAASLNDSLSLFRLALPLLKDCKFVFATQRGVTPGFAVNQTFAAGGAIRSLFKTDTILVLDINTLREMECGISIYPIDYSISLDTQAISYLKPYVNGEASRVPLGFVEVFEFIARDDVNIDPMPYMQENLQKLSNSDSAAKIFDTLKAYEVLRTIDTEWLRVRGEIRTKLTEYEIALRAQQHISSWYRTYNNSNLMDAMHFRHYFMYCHLLIMATIQIGSPRASIFRKMQTYLEVCDAKLATIGGREAAIARSYFERGQKLGFFGKIQAKKPNLFELLRNMAWDLWHVRQLEEMMTLRSSNAARYFLPALLTFDKGLIEIIDLYPLRSCAFIEGRSGAMPFYDGDWFNLIGDTEKNTFIERFYSDAARSSRLIRSGAVKQQIDSIVATLEDELSTVASVPISSRRDKKQ